MLFQAGNLDQCTAARPQVRLVDPLAISAELATAWDALAISASEPNAFAERWCLAPALQLLDPARSARLLAVELDGALIGMACLMVRGRYGPLPLRHWTNWTHSNHFHGAPLVHRGQEEIFWQAVLQWCGEQQHAPFFLQWQKLTRDGPLHRALVTVAGMEAGPDPVVHQESRAMLASELEPAAYWDFAVRGKKRKELRRQTARLTELGAIEHRHWQRDEEVRPWIDAFLALEAEGWKGREGSSLASNPATEAWLRTIIVGARDAGRLDMRMLVQNGRPLAMLINFFCPPGGFSFKTAYAEDMARFSPGVLLQQANLAVLDRDDLQWIDSCAAPDHPMIDSIWRERRTLIWINVPLRSGRSDRWRLATLRRAESFWHRMRARPATMTVDQDA